VLSSLAYVALFPHFWPPPAPPTSARHLPDTGHGVLLGAAVLGDGWLGATSPGMALIGWASRHRRPDRARYARE